MSNPKRIDYSRKEYCAGRGHAYQRMGVMECGGRTETVICVRCDKRQIRRLGR